MALTVASLGHAVDTSATNPVNTVSITPGTQTVVFAALLGTGVNPSGLAPQNAAGLTWANMFLDTNLGSTRTFSLWRAMASSPSTAVIPITNANGIAFLYEIVEVSGGPDTTGTNGSGAIRQAVQNFGTSPLDAGLTPPSVATSALVGFWSSRDDNDTATVGSGYTQLNNFGGGSAIGMLGSEWQIGVTSGACGWGAFGTATVVTGIEVQAATGPPPAVGGGGTGIYRIARRPWR